MSDIGFFLLPALPNSSNFIYFDKTKLAFHEQNCNSLDSKGKFTKNVVLIFLHQEWGITCTSGESIKVRRNIPKDKLKIKRQIIQIQNSTQHQFLLQWTHSVFEKQQHNNNNNKTCIECKRESVSIKEIDVQTSYETTSVGS